MWALPKVIKIPWFLQHIGNIGVPEELCENAEGAPNQPVQTRGVQEAAQEGPEGALGGLGGVWGGPGGPKGKRRGAKGPPREARRGLGILRAGRFWPRWVPGGGKIKDYY